MPTSLESTVAAIVNRAATAMASEIAQAVRQNIAEQITGISPSTAATTMAPRRGPGRPRTAVSLAAVHARTAAPPSAPKKRRSGGRRNAKEVAADEAAILDFVKGNAGLRSEQIGKALNMPKTALAAGLLALRSGHKLKTHGQRRSMTYQAA